MGMEIMLKVQHEGESVRITLLIFSNSDDTAYSREISINELAIVKFCFTQNIENRHIPYLKSKVMVRKKPMDCVVKVKVYSHEVSYSSEIVYSENEFWSELGKKDRDLKFEYSNAYLFYVTVNASKVKSVIHDKLYSDVDFTDFHLSSAEGSVAVHKACLAAHSEVFKTMLSQQWKETNEAKLQIEGVTLKTLQHLKKYIYLGLLPDDGLEQLLSIASCYLLEDLKEECLSKMTNNVKPEDFYNMLEYSMENKMPDLTFALIKATPKSVVESADKLRKNKNEEEVKEE